MTEEQSAPIRRLEKLCDVLSPNLVIKTTPMVVRYNQVCALIYTAVLHNFLGASESWIRTSDQGINSPLLFH